MTLEDHAGDVVGKARKGLGLSPEQVTEAGGFTAESYAKFEQDGTYDELPDLVKIGELLHLNPDKLATIVSGWCPRARKKLFKNKGFFVQFTIFKGAGIAKG